MVETLVHADSPAAGSKATPSPKMNPELEEAIARVAAKVEGKPWAPPHQDGRGEASSSLTVIASTNSVRSVTPLGADAPG